MPTAYLYGMVVSSTVLHLKQPYPAADGYAEVAQQYRMVSGETANAALVLKSLGVDCVVQGNWMGEANEALIRGVFTERGIDCAPTATLPGYAGMDEWVVTDGRTRTVFSRYQDLYAGPRRWDAADEAALGRADLCLIDPQFGALSLEAARLARRLGKRLVGIDCGCDSEMLDLCDVVAVSEESLGWIHPGVPFDSLAPRYLDRARGLVVFTFGAKPMAYGRRGGPLQTMPSFKVRTVDTLGAGDTFKAALGYGLLQGWDDEALVRFAAATAALNCQRVPGAMNAPTLREVQAFLAGQVY